MKHAYLILVHNKPCQLNELLGILDDDRNDIFIHIDLNSRMRKEEIRRLKSSEVYYVDRQIVKWGGVRNDPSRTSVV